ncbi:hypothetical protein CASFOL_019558 [Castilleja foliolosa]|uniref:ARM repeat superfamily protein n=1 Tax=Castilleja foliolosa TaxID=1961234 RepID=A0ABD3D5Z2_9LAMI
MEQEEEQQLIGPSSGPIMSATVGRVMTTLLNAKPKKLHDAVSRLHSPSKIGPLDASLEQSLWFLHKYISETADKGEPLDQVLVPILQHFSTFRESKKGNQTLILLNWLFQDEVLFQAIVRNMTAIISRRDDRYVALGWCFLGRSLIEFENVANTVSVNAISQKYDVILKTFSSCVTHLLSIISYGSNMKEGFELPTRLAVAAADFVLSLTVALSKNDKITKKQNSSSVNAKNQTLNFLPGATNDGDENTLRKASELSSSLELKLLLLNNLSELITLVEKLTAWSRKSRSLHAKGLERVSNWLQEIKQLYGSIEDEAESQMLKSGSLLLSSCWKHYGMLMQIEDHNFSQQHKVLLGQYISGIQFYAENETEEPNNNSRDSKSETINFFLNCLLLLLGRLSNLQFGNAIEEFGSQISQVLMSQLRCSDEKVIDGTISIFKAVILNTNHTLSTRSLDDVRQMDALLPVLLSLLDERDAAAKAIVKLLAEYCSICSDNNCLYEVLKRVNSENIAQRRNAVDFVAELIQILSGKDIANHLLECLGDEDQIIQNQAVESIPMIDPKLVLPRLVELSYSTQESLRLSADNALIALLVNHKQKPEILCLLLDCLSKDSQNPDSDRLLKFLSEWAKHVEDWHVMVGPLIDKMLAEPTNAVIVRFLSHISEYLVEVVDAVFNRLLVYVREQKEIDELFSKGKGLIDSNSESLGREQRLFTRLCPLLVIRLLPLRVFDDLDSHIVYGEFFRNSVHDIYLSTEGSECIAALMINRALSKSEFEDVRKLAAELCGRIHPKVLVPVLSSQLESAASAKDVFKIKVCLFSFCTSLMVRGNDVYRDHPDLFRIKKTIRKVLSWASVEGDEISKAQHGCIDCMALMLCTELQASEYSKGTIIPKDSVLAYVINQLTSHEGDIFFESDESDSTIEATNRLSFRLCMANVLISTCKKISDAGKKPFIRKVLPCVIRSVGVMVEPEIRAACVQVLFTVAYLLKSLIYPYSDDLLKAALKSLREGSPKEKISGAKLLMCLMASEEDVVESISTGLIQARSLLQDLASTDPSTDVRQLCQQLLLCLTSQ